MGNSDISRSSFDPRKHYSGVRSLQGRVLTDELVNASERIHGEERRQTRVDVVGPVGTSDDGFRVSNLNVTPAGLDFTIGAGALYLGGLRLEQEEPELYRLQYDWLQQPKDVLPTLQGAGPRVDLVYLEAWEDTITPFEDQELREQALGEPDTSNRTRVTRRVRVVPDVNVLDCSDAWEKWIAKSAATQGVLDDEHALRPQLEMQVDFRDDVQTEDLCTPSAQGGYAFAENQAIRVELTGPRTFTWGFDNASAFYRVSVDPDRQTITFLDQPRDTLRWPRLDQTVELLAWGARLSNGQKSAEGRGLFRKVGTAFDPNSAQLKLDLPLPANFGRAWQGRDDAAELGDIGAHHPLELYLCVWDRGSDQASPAEIAFAPGSPVDLGSTGLSVTFSGLHFPNEAHWIIAARPSTPRKVVPWELEEGRAPHGVTRYAAPLALIRWVRRNGVIEGEVIDDCRPRFRPLTRQGGCCRYSVGDESRSFGDFSSIQAAVNALPVTGGEICVLAGEHASPVRLRGKRDIWIHGCGVESRVVGSDVRAQPVFQVVGCERIRISNLQIEADDEVGVEVGGEFDSKRSSDISLFDLSFEIANRSAVDARAVRGFSLQRCKIDIHPRPPTKTADPDAGFAPGVFVQASDATIEDNEIVLKGRRLLPRPGMPGGGLQIGGGSRRVSVFRNTIRGGNGHGITLGSIVLAPRAEVRRFLVDPRKWMKGLVPLKGYIGISVSPEGCIQFTPKPPLDDPDGNTPREPVAISEGALSRLEIRDNAISEMGGSGVGVVHYFDLEDDEGSDYITTDELTIANNRIENCLGLGRGVVDPELSLVSALSAIALADGQHIRILANRIEGNGTRHGYPCCGVFVLRADGLDIDDNIVVGNGRTGMRFVRSAWRGGIVVVHANEPVQEKSATGRNGNGWPALRVHRNIVHSVDGPALAAAAHGLMSVESNQLTTERTQPRLGVYERLEAMGRVVAARTIATSEIIDLGTGEAVSLFNYGVSRELLTYGKLYPSLATVGAVAVAKMALNPSSRVGGFVGANAAEAPFVNTIARSRIVGGNILFANNQVCLDMLDLRQSKVLSSVMISGRDDVQVTGNQFDVAMDSDFISTNLFAFSSASIRVTDNRFKERLQRADASAITVGMMNATVHNQGTHCFRVKSPTGTQLDSPNQTLLEILDKGSCAPCKKFFDPRDLKIKIKNGVNEMAHVNANAFGIGGLSAGTEAGFSLNYGVHEAKVSFIAERPGPVEVRALDANGTVIHAVEVADAASSEATVVPLLTTGELIHRVELRSANALPILLDLCLDRDFDRAFDAAKLDQPIHRLALDHQP